MTQERSERRAGGGSEVERRYDGGGQDSPMAQSERARGNEEPDPIAEAPAMPLQMLKGNDGKPIPVRNDSGVAFAETSGEVDGERPG